MGLTPAQIEEIRRLLGDRPTYPDLKALIANGHLLRRSTGYEVVTKAGFDALIPFMKRVLINNETGAAIIKLYPKQKS